LASFTDPHILIVCDDDFTNKPLPLTAWINGYAFQGNLLILGEKNNCCFGLSEQQVALVKAQIRRPS
jgi:hypothetical protein